MLFGIPQNNLIHAIRGNSYFDRKWFILDRQLFILDREMVYFRPGNGSFYTGNCLF